MKLVPLTVRVNPAPPTVAEFGESDVSVGADAVTVNVNAFDVAPSGFTTVTCGVPAAAMSVLRIDAVSCVGLANVVVRFAPFQRTTAPLPKFVPFAVKVNPGPAAVPVFGVSDVRVGAAPVTVNVTALDVVPSEFTTVTCGVPVAATSALRIDAVSCVALAKVVVRFAPFQRTTAPLRKFIPFTVRVKAGPPAVAVFGDSDVRVGAAPVTVNVSALDVVPSEFTTVTCGVPVAATSALRIDAVS